MWVALFPLKKSVPMKGLLEIPLQSYWFGERLGMEKRWGWVYNFHPSQHWPPNLIHLQAVCFRDKGSKNPWNLWQSIREHWRLVLTNLHTPESGGQERWGLGNSTLTGDSSALRPPSPPAQCSWGPKSEKHIVNKFFWPDPRGEVTRSSFISWERKLLKQIWVYWLLKSCGK